MMKKNRVLVTGPSCRISAASESFGLLGALGVFGITNKRALLSTFELRCTDSERLGETRTHTETLSEAQRAREVGGAHGHMGPHTMQALSTECLEGEGH